MSGNFMIIKTKKLSAREVKKKFRDFIDEISDDCGPEIEQMADDLKAHGDEFVDAISGEGFERGGGYNRGGGEGYNRGGSGGGGYNRSHMNRAWHKNEGSWEEREELRKKNEQKLQELDRQMQELKQQLQQDY